MSLVAILAAIKAAPIVVPQHPLVHARQTTSNIDGVNFEYLGCFLDNAGRDFAVRVWTWEHGSHQSCSARCSSKGYSIFAIQHGSECYCDDEYGTPAEIYMQLPNSRCERPGHPAGTGGNWANSVFRVGELGVPSPPATPSPLSPPPAAHATFSYIGCFKDNGARDMSIRVHDAHDHESCNAACAARNKAIFTLQWGTQCFCDDDVGTPAETYHSLPEHRCRRAGFPLRSGGAWANSAFSVGTTPEPITAPEPSTPPSHPPSSPPTRPPSPPPTHPPSPPPPVHPPSSPPMHPPSSPPTRPPSTPPTHPPSPPPTRPPSPGVPTLPDEPDPTWRRITCPVMSAMVKNGDLVPSAAGMISKQQTFDALLKVGISLKVATQATDGNFDHLPGEKLMNVFRMNTINRHGAADPPGPLEHFRSTGIRDGDRPSAFHYDTFDRCAAFDGDASSFTNVDIMQCAILAWDHERFGTLGNPAQQIVPVLPSNDVREEIRPPGCGTGDTGTALCGSQLHGSIIFMSQEFWTPTGPHGTISADDMRALWMDSIYPPGFEARSPRHCVDTTDPTAAGCQACLDEVPRQGGSLPLATESVPAQRYCRCMFSKQLSDSALQAVSAYTQIGCPIPPPSTGAAAPHAVAAHAVQRTADKHAPSANRTLSTKSSDDCHPFCGASGDFGARAANGSAPDSCYPFCEATGSFMQGEVATNLPPLPPYPPFPPAPPPMRFEYMGCYHDNGDRDLRPWMPGEQTPESCNAMCAERNKAFFALQHGTQCFCDNDYGTPPETYHALPDSRCTREDFPDLYGGEWANAVYRVESPASPPASPQGACIRLPSKTFNMPASQFDDVYTPAELRAAGYFDTFTHQEDATLTTTVSSTCNGAHSFSFAGDGGRHFINVEGGSGTPHSVTDTVSVGGTRAATRFEVRADVTETCSISFANFEVCQS